jgi:hypothetical protein
MLPLGSAKSTIKIDNGSMNMPPSNKKKKTKNKGYEHTHELINMNHSITYLYIGGLGFI